MLRAERQSVMGFVVTRGPPRGTEGSWGSTGWWCPCPMEPSDMGQTEVPCWREERRGDSWRSQGTQEANSTASLGSGETLCWCTGVRRLPGQTVSSSGKNEKAPKEGWWATSVPFYPGLGVRAGLCVCAADVRYRGRGGSWSQFPLAEYRCWFQVRPPNNELGIESGVMVWRNVRCGPCPVSKAPLHYRRPELKPVAHANQAVPCAMPGASSIYISSHLIPPSHPEEAAFQPLPWPPHPVWKQETD